MTTTEGAVKTEMEAKGIYEQVRLAVEATQRGKMDSLAASTVDVDWDAERDDKPQTGDSEERDMLDQHRVCLLNVATYFCRSLAFCGECKKFSRTTTVFYEP